MKTQDILQAKFENNKIMSVESIERDDNKIVNAFVQKYKDILIYGETFETDSYKIVGPYSKYELDENSVRIRPVNNYNLNQVVLFAQFKFKGYLKEMPENVATVDDLPTEFEGLETDYWIGNNGKVIA